MRGKETKKVLVVDDEETLTWSMTKTLAKDKDKYELIIANTGKEALQAMQEDHIDVVMNMPVARPVRHEIRRKAPDTVVLTLDYGLHRAITNEFRVPTGWSEAKIGAIEDKMAIRLK